MIMKNASYIVFLAAFNHLDHFNSALGGFVN
jgi:hypothetical protein